MKNRFLIGLCLVLVQSRIILAEGTYEVKRGTYPYMAFLYYPDETVVEKGARFFRSAVLIKPEWLLSSAIDHPTSQGFPRKTLLARMGAVTIDAKVTLNEDEDEQEREIIQIVRPTIHNLDKWYFTDVTLLQTLLPFNMTPAVGLASYYFNQRYNLEQKCLILVYAAKYENTTEDKELMQMSVELMVPANSGNCGAHFSELSMTCAFDTEETKNSLHNPNFCHGNAGGPLICDNDVIGLQTYINFVCTAPHLYQILSAWENLITCGTQRRCSQEYCSKICTTIDKDPPSTGMTISRNSDTSSESVVADQTSEVLRAVEITHLGDVPYSVAETNTETSSSTTQLSSVSPEFSTSSIANETSYVTEIEVSSEFLRTSMNTSPTASPTTSEITETKNRTKSTKSTTYNQTKTTKITTSASSETTTIEEDSSKETENPLTWHGEDRKTKANELKVFDTDSSEDESEVPDRHPYMEAKVVSNVMHKKTSAGKNTCLLKSLFVGVVVLALLI